MGTAVPAELYATTYIAGRAAAWGGDRRGDAQTFLRMVRWPDLPHPFSPTGKYWDMYYPDDVPVPGAFARNDRTPPPHDIGTMILEFAQIAYAWGMQGRDLFRQEAREVAFVQYAHKKGMDEIGIPLNIRAVHNVRVALTILQDMAWGELYDLESHPGEFLNLWDDPAQAHQKARPMEWLIRAALAHVDRSPMPTGRA